MKKHTPVRTDCLPVWTYFITMKFYLISPILVQIICLAWKQQLAFSQPVIDATEMSAKQQVAYTYTHPDIDEKLLSVMVDAARLSLAVGDDNPQDFNNLFEKFQVYEDKPFKAIVAKKGGYCFAAFDGEFKTRSFLFSSSPNFEVACNKSGECCSIRSQWVDDYKSAAVRSALESDLRSCAAECDDPSECVVVTGHAYGAGLAAVAAVTLEHLNPYYISFSQPKIVKKGCSIDRSRWFRFLNSRSDFRVHIQTIVYDSGERFPGQFLKSDLRYVGHLLLVTTTDHVNMAYLGWDNQEFFLPIDWTRFSGLMTVNGTDSFKTPGFDPDIGTFGGYLDRLLDIQKEYSIGGSTFPVSTSGFKVNRFCTRDRECASNKCKRATWFPIPLKNIAPLRCFESP
jgi:Lipase (class 3)